MSSIPFLKTSEAFHSGFSALGTRYLYQLGAKLNPQGKYITLYLCSYDHEDNERAQRLSIEKDSMTTSNPSRMGSGSSSYSLSSISYLGIKIHINDWKKLEEKKLESYYLNIIIAIIYQKPIQDPRLDKLKELNKELFKEYESKVNINNKESIINVIKEITQKFFSTYNLVLEQDVSDEEEIQKILRDLEDRAQQPILNF